MATINSFEDLTQHCMTLFNNTHNLCMPFLVPIAVGKIIFYTVSGDDGSEVKGVIKGVVLYFVLALIFEPVLGVLMDIFQQFLPDYFSSVDYGVAHSAAHGSSIGTAATSTLPSMIDGLLNLILGFLFRLAMWIHIIFMGLMSAMAPIVFLLGAVLGIGLGIRLFFGILIMAGSWPIMWASVDGLYGVIRATGKNEITDYVVEAILLLMKISAPLALGYSAMISSAGSAISRVGRSTFSFGSKGSSYATGGAKRGARLLKTGISLADKGLASTKKSTKNRTAPIANYYSGMAIKKDNNSMGLQQSLSPAKKSALWGNSGRERVQFQASERTSQGARSVNIAGESSHFVGSVTSRQASSLQNSQMFSTNEGSFRAQRGQSEALAPDAYLKQSPIRSPLSKVQEPVKNPKIGFFSSAKVPLEHISQNSMRSVYGGGLTSQSTNSQVTQENVVISKRATPLSH